MSRFRTLSLAALAIVGLVLSATTLRAEEPVAPPKAKPTMGVVKSVDAANHTFVLTTGKGEKAQDVTITVNDQTKYKLDNKDATMDEVVKAGAHVSVTHENNVASLVSAKTPKPKAEKPAEHHAH